MEYTRRALFFGLGAGYASGWWVAAVFGYKIGEDDYRGLWVIPGISTGILVIAGMVFFTTTWNQK